MNIDEINEYLNEKFPEIRNKPKTLKENFPKKQNENSNFEQIFYKTLENYVFGKI